MRPIIHPGPWLLRPGGQVLATHRLRFGPLPTLSADELADRCAASGVLGRGGAGFPFATKLRAAASRRAVRRHVVVNVAEGEPASAKDAALVETAPHLVLDGAALTAAALRAREVALVVPHERPWLGELLRHALAERPDRGLRWRFHTAAPGFVSGESSAVTELVAGRPNLPVTSWAPTAVAGVAGRPTLLSNAETFAQVATLVLAPDRVPGPATEPGTRLLSVTRPDGIHVVEVTHGSPWTEVLTEEEVDRPVLLGGFHGTWLAPGSLLPLTVSASMREHGAALGAGIVIPLAAGTCPLLRTAEILDYLAAQSAGRCGPCFHGLPALADAFGRAVRGGSTAEVENIVHLVRGRGACSHPDGTVRLAASALAVFADDLAAHRSGHCSAVSGSLPAGLRALGATA